MADVVAAPPTCPGWRGGCRQATRPFRLREANTRTHGGPRGPRRRAPRHAAHLSRCTQVRMYARPQVRSLSARGPRGARRARTRRLARVLALLDRLLLFRPVSARRTRGHGEDTRNAFPAIFPPRSWWAQQGLNLRLPPCETSRGALVCPTNSHHLALCLLLSHRFEQWLSGKCQAFRDRLGPPSRQLRSFQP